MLWKKIINIDSTEISSSMAEKISDEKMFKAWKGLRLRQKPNCVGFNIFLRSK